MALIQCPECNNKISSMAKVCPHCKHQIISVESKICPECGNSTSNDICEICGYPISETIIVNDNIKSTKTFVTKKKIVVISIILLLLIFSCMAFNYVSVTNKETAYHENLYRATNLMIEGAGKAENSCYLIRNVWHNSIYQKADSTTDKFTKTNGKFNDDFNESLSALFNDDNFGKDIKFIAENRNSVNDIMGELLSPPEKYEDAYEEIQSLYEAYLKLADLAITANGSLNSFTDDSNSAISDFSHDYQIIQQYIK